MLKTKFTMGVFFHHHPFPGKLFSGMRELFRVPEMPDDREYVRYRFANHVSNEWVPMVYRFLCFAFVLTVYILGLMNYTPGNAVRDFSYLTKWGVILDWFIFLLLIFAHFNYPISGFFCGKDSRGHKKAVKYYHLFIEVIQFIVVSADVCIVIMYWSFLFSPNGDTSKDYGIYDRNDPDGPIKEVLTADSNGLWHCEDSSINLCNVPMNNYDILLTVFFHAVCPALVIIEFLFNRVPVRKRHLFYMAIFAVVYIFGVNLPVSLASYPVYSIMTWKSWWTAVYCAGAVILAFMGSGFQFFMRWHRIQRAAHSQSRRELESINTTEIIQGSCEFPDYAVEDLEKGNSKSSHNGNDDSNVELVETIEEPARRQVTSENFSRQITSETPLAGN